MNAPLTWPDPVVAEIHAIRAELANEYADDLVAYSNAAVAHCKKLNFQVGTVRETPLAINQPDVGEAYGIVMLKST